MLIKEPSQGSPGFQLAQSFGICFKHYLYLLFKKPKGLATREYSTRGAVQVRGRFFVFMRVAPQ